METRPAGDSAAPAAAPEKASVVEDFIDIFHSPTSVFARRENSGFWTHLLIITLISGLFAFASRSVFDQVFEADFQRRAADMVAKGVPADMLETQRTWSVKLGGVAMYLYPPLTVILAALITWPIAVIFGAKKLRYGQAAMILTLAFIPRLIASLITAVQVVATDASTITSMFQLTMSPARFMDPDSPNRVLLGIMSRFDLFVLWATVLVGIGIATIGKIPKAKAFAAAAIVWAIPTVMTFFA